MKLLSMRDLNVQDPLPGLGEKVEPPAKPVVPMPEPTATPGVYRMPDGKLVTDMPENERANCVTNYFVQAAHHSNYSLEASEMSNWLAKGGFVVVASLP
jgi:hypothetical protein